MFHVLEGQAQWCRVVGKPYTNSFGVSEWSTDVVIDSATKKEIIKLGFPVSKIKNKEGVGDYIQFRRRSTKMDGSEAAPINIVGPDAEPWDQTKLIGNGSIVRVRYALNQRKDRQGKEILQPSIVALQVVKHVPYSPRSGFEPVAGDEEWTKVA